MWNLSQYLASVWKDKDNEGHSTALFRTFLLGFELSIGIGLGIR